MCVYELLHGINRRDYDTMESSIFTDTRTHTKKKKCKQNIISWGFIQLKPISRI